MEILQLLRELCHRKFDWQVLRLMSLLYRDYFRFTDYNNSFLPRKILPVTAVIKTAKSITRFIVTNILSSILFKCICSTAIKSNTLLFPVELTIVTTNRSLALLKIIHDLVDIKIENP